MEEKIKYPITPITVTKIAYNDGIFEYRADYKIPFENASINMEFTEYLQVEKTTDEIKLLFRQKAKEYLTEIIRSEWG